MPELLKRTDMASFHRSFVAMREVQLYAAGVLIAAIMSFWIGGGSIQNAIAVGLVFLLYPLLEYLLHRYVLHNVLLCRSRATAGIWWRLHYRHHTEPNDEEVLLGTPFSLISTVVISAMLIAAFLPGWSNFLAAMSAGFICAILFEYVHALDHSNVKLSNPYLRKLRKHHLDHHFLEERGNFGLTSDIVDRLFGTAYATRSILRRSPTVRNLGYGDEERRRYPWVAEIEEQRGSAPTP